MPKGIYKQKGSNFYWIRYVDLDGNLRRESTKTEKIKEALAKLEERRVAIRKGLEPEPIKKTPSHTFSFLVNEYFKNCQKERGFNKSKRYILRELEALFGNLPIKSITTMLIEQFQTDLLNKGKKPATVNKYITVLKACLNKGYNWDITPEETIKRIKKVKKFSETKRLRYLSIDECHELIKHCNGNTRNIVITALNTGMRKGEILSLKWDNVDLKHGFILLDKTKNGDRREIPLNDTLKDLFNGMASRFKGGYVFCDAEGKPYQDVKRSFNTAVRKAGIKDFHFHDLRHTFASHLVMAGVDITTVSRLLGHKSLSMTLRYSHLAPEHLSKAVNMLNFTTEKKSTAYLLHSVAHS